MLLKSLLILALILGVLAAVIATRPAKFHVLRTAVINAPADQVFAQVNTIANWNTWSPWAKLDPAATNTYTGPASGTGAAMSWSGNSQVGQGTMTITDSQPNQSVDLRLEFLKPMQATNTARFTFTPRGDATEVTWTMDGTNNFMAKAINLVMDCEKMVGGQFEEGLANLKALAEKPAS